MILITMVIVSPEVVLVCVAEVILVDLCTILDLIHGHGSVQAPMVLLMTPAELMKIDVATLL